jgi:hypothetical protein
MDATLLVFFLGLPLAGKTDADYMALLFLLFSESVLYVAARFIAKSKGSGLRLFLNASVLTTLVFYFAANALLALLIAPLYGGTPRHFFLLELILLFAAAILTVVFTAFSKRFSRNEAASALGGKIVALTEGVRSQLADSRNAQCFHELSLLCDELMLLDPRASVPQTDERLVEELRAFATMRAGADIENAQLIERAYTLARQRNEASKKKGASF